MVVCVWRVVNCHLCCEASLRMRRDVRLLTSVNIGKMQRLVLAVITVHSLGQHDPPLLFHPLWLFVGDGRSDQGEWCHFLFWLSCFLCALSGTVVPVSEGPLWPHFQELFLSCNCVIFFRTIIKVISWLIILISWFCCEIVSAKDSEAFFSFFEKSFLWRSHHRVPLSVASHGEQNTFISGRHSPHRRRPPYIAADAAAHAPQTPWAPPSSSARPLAASPSSSCCSSSSPRRCPAVATAPHRTAAAWPCLSRAATAALASSWPAAWTRGALWCLPAASSLRGPGPRACPGRAPAAWGSSNWTWPKMKTWCRPRGRCRSCPRKVGRGGLWGSEVKGDWCSFIFSFQREKVVFWSVYDLCLKFTVFPFSQVSSSENSI